VLEEAQPAIEAAEQAVGDIKSNDINEIKALNSPPTAIAMVCQATFHYMEHDSKFRRNDEWGTVKARLLGNMKLLEDLKNYNIAKCNSDMAKGAK
jgi:hypothetical protein